MLLAPIIWIFTVIICFVFAGKYWWMPPPISEHGIRYDAQFMATLVVTGIIFFLAQMALGYVIVKFRDDGRRAVYSHGNNKMEAIWTTATGVLFVGLVIMGSQIWASVHFTPAPADAMPIEVTAKQFAWSFRYAGPDGKFGKTDIRLINDAAGNPVGLDENDPDGKDDVVTSAIRVPAGKPILLTLIARDVIHNFFVRELRLKQDLVPGMNIPFHFQADKPGSYEIACSELCGLGHHQMRSTLEVVSQAEFDAWIQQQLANR